jgi:hypothetical protein
MQMVTTKRHFDSQAMPAACAHELKEPSYVPSQFVIVSMNQSHQPTSDLNKLLDNTEFKNIVGEILTTGRHTPQKMHSVVDGYVDMQQCLLAETGRQWESFILRKHFPHLVSPPKSSSWTSGYKSELKHVRL